LSRISRIAKAFIVELGKNSGVGNYSLYTAQSRPNRAMTAGESLIDKRGHRKTTSRIADPYGLINRWKTRTEIPSQELLVLRPVGLKDERGATPLPQGS
jgi:hypothetical protein